jgi:hypothetical protein
MDRRASSTLAIADLVIGIALLIVALWLHLVIPGIPFALMILGGLLLVFSGFYYR